MTHRILRHVKSSRPPGSNGLHSTLYERIAAGNFPKPIKLGERAVGWLEGDIADWQAGRIAARDASYRHHD